MARVRLIRGVEWTLCRWGKLGQRDGACHMCDGVRIPDGTGVGVRAECSACPVGWSEISGHRR